MIHDVNIQYYPKIFVKRSLNLDYRPKMSLRKVGTPKCGIPIPKREILIVDSMDHQEYFLGIILRHVLLDLDQQFGFYRPACNSSEGHIWPII